MDIGGQTITTPLDNPCQYQPDWRNYVALALARPGSSVPRGYEEYEDDKWICRQVAYLRGGGRKRVPQKHRNMRLANMWYQSTRPSDLKYRLEPLLLTAASMDVISLDLGGGIVDTDAFVAYEKMYFNVRLDDGRLHPSCQLRQYFALPTGEFDEDTPKEQIWKMIGALMGYDTLTSVWLWKDAHGRKDDSQESMLDEMWRVAQSRVFMSMFEDRIGHESMAKLLSALTSQTKMIHDSKDEASADLEATKALMSILYKASPQVMESAKVVDAQSHLLSSMQKAIDAEAKIEGVDLGDFKISDGYDAVDRLLMTNFDKE